MIPISLSSVDLSAVVASLIAVLVSVFVEKLV